MQISSKYLFFWYFKILLFGDFMDSFLDFKWYFYIKKKIEFDQCSPPYFYFRSHISYAQPSRKTVWRVLGSMGSKPRALSQGLQAQGSKPRAPSQGHLAKGSKPSTPGQALQAKGSLYKLSQILLTFPWLLFITMREIILPCPIDKHQNIGNGQMREMVYRWCTDGAPIVHRWCTDGTPMMHWWCVDGTPMVPMHIGL